MESPLDQAKSEFFRIVTEIGDHEQIIEFCNWAKEVMEEEIIGSNQDVSTTLSSSRNKQQPKLPTS